MKKLIYVLGLLLILLGSFPTLSDALTITYGYEFSGATPPAGAAPWLSATFIDNADGTVQLTLSALGLIDAEFVSNWLFNFDPVLTLGSLSFDLVDTSDAVPSLSTGLDAFKADGDGLYDILFSFGQNTFTAGESVVFNIFYSGAGTFNANSFNFLSQPAGGNGPFISAAHVQGIGENSGWVTVPEPGILILLGSGLIGLWGFRKKFKR